MTQTATTGTPLAETLLRVLQVATTGLTAPRHGKVSKGPRHAARPASRLPAK